MAEHTPGPWSTCSCGKCWFVSAPETPICRVEAGEWGDEYAAIRLVGTSSLDQKAEAYMDRIAYGSIPVDEARANARLIAAAPDLLAALKIAHERFVCGSNCIKGCPHAAAIAKAEGK